MNAGQEPYIYAADLNAKELLSWLENQLHLVKAFVSKKAAIESDFTSSAFYCREITGCFEKDGLYGVRTSQGSNLPVEVCLMQKQISEFREFLNNSGLHLKDFQDEDHPARQKDSLHN